VSGAAHPARRMQQTIRSGADFTSYSALLRN
jgi:hypothetical protein